jgi:hypothetical protein
MRTTLLALVLAGLVPTGASAASLVGFRSPSGNIGCFVGDDYSARCDIRDRTWSPPPRPARCGSITDYGQGLEVGRTGRGHAVCAGDTAMGDQRRLAYGHSTTAGRYTCSSARSGITCRNRRTGHGFFISRTYYRLF